MSKDFAEKIVEKLDKEIAQNNLENVIIGGDFNCVTSLNDRNTNKYTQTGNLYKKYGKN